jgi:hypothetical protein
MSRCLPSQMSPKFFTLRRQQRKHNALGEIEVLQRPIDLCPVEKLE